MSGIAEFDAMLYGVPSQASLNYFRNEYNSVMQQANNFVGDLGKQFLQAATNVYNNYVSPIAISSIKNILKTADTVISQYDGIRVCTDVHDFTQASFTMQRFIMAEPGIRRAWQMNQNDGFMDTYFSAEPDFIADEHHDYRRVKDGHVDLIYDEDGKVDGYRYRTYYVGFETDPNDIELSAEERDDILLTWENAQVIMKHSDVDLTNPSIAVVA